MVLQVCRYRFRASSVFIAFRVLRKEDEEEPKVRDMDWYEVKSILNKLANDFTVYPDESKAIDKALTLVDQRISYEERMKCMKENA